MARRQPCRLVRKSASSCGGKGKKPRKEREASLNLKQGHVKGTRFRTAWQQLHDFLERRACSAGELRGKFEALQELTEQDVSRLGAAVVGKRGIDCRKAFFVSSQKQAGTWEMGMVG